MLEAWVQIPDFPDYEISSWGNVYNTKHCREVHVSKTLQGALKVSMYRDGVRYTRSVKVLVAEAFVDGKSEFFDTPILLDMDQENVHVDNIVWRPRWFAHKYSIQTPAHLKWYKGRGPVINTTTGIIYEDIIEAGMSLGLLYQDISASIVSGEYTWPVRYIFAMYKEEDWG